MTEFVRTGMGGRIAVDRFGEGPAVIMVNGALSFREIDHSGTRLGEALAARGLSFITYDRPGRGETEVDAPYTLDGDIDAIAAVIDMAGGSATLLGSSSGAVISLAAAARGLPVNGLILWEAPLGPELGTDAAEYDSGLREVVAKGDDAATVEWFMIQQMPPAWLERVKQAPEWPLQVSTAQSLVVDTAAIKWAQSAAHAELWGGINQPTLVLLGEQTLPLMEVGAQAVVANVPHAILRRIPISAAHSWDLAAIVDTVTRFVRESVAKD